jgi:hypothetical protein
MNVIARFSIPTSTGKTVPAQIANDCKPATDAKTTQPLSVAEVLVATVPVAAAKQSETKLMRSSHSVEEGSPQKTKADGTKTIEAAEAKNDVPAILQGTPVSPVLSTNQETAAVVSGMVLAMVVASKSKDNRRSNEIDPAGNNKECGRDRTCIVRASRKEFSRGKWFNRSFKSGRDRRRSKYRDAVSAADSSSSSGQRRITDC